jgi:hypothetical protein
VKTRWAIPAHHRFIGLSDLDTEFRLDREVVLEGFPGILVTDHAGLVRQGVFVQISKPVNSSFGDGIGHHRSLCLPDVQIASPTTKLLASKVFIVGASNCL